MDELFIRPDVRAFLDFLNNLPGPRGFEMGPEGARKLMITGRYALDAPPRDLAVVRDIAGPIPMRLYDVRGEREPGPVLMFVHGGGWVIGDFETHEPFCTELAAELDLPVIALDYRRAPEHPFPAAFEDSLAAARWIAAGNEAIGPRTTSLFLAGDSAGGNIAAAVSAALRDAPAEIPVAGQWLIYPAADPCVRYPSYDQFCEGFALTKPSMDWYEECYAGPADDWRYCPLLAGASGLPPTLVVTASLDPIRDQGRAYAARCAEAGVEIAYYEALGTIHGFINLRKAIPSTSDDLARCYAYLKPWVERAR